MRSDRGDLSIYCNQPKPQLIKYKKNPFLEPDRMLGYSFVQREAQYYPPRLALGLLFANK